MVPVNYKFYNNIQRKFMELIYSLMIRCRSYFVSATDLVVQLVSQALHKPDEYLSSISGIINVPILSFGVD